MMMHGLANVKWIGHILHWNSLLKSVIEGKIEERIEGTGRRGRRLHGIKETRGKCNLKRKH
jgi:hypothetical protein